MLNQDFSHSNAVTAQEIEHFARDGFLSLPRLLDDATLQTLRDYYDKIVNKTIVLPGDRQLGGVTRQIMQPSAHIEYFRSNPAIDRAKSIARELLGTQTVEVNFDMLIYKPPMHPKPTPWHQDFAYNAMPFVPAGANMDSGGLQFWVALDNVDVENGCMHFLPGYHQQRLKPHYVYAGEATDAGRLLATQAFGDADLPNAGVSCPLSAGGATVHTYGTPHYTPPNISTNRGRRAYIFNIRRCN
ncbi:MAG: hypothetical protein JWM57_1132 [Phycisphaerales bacterium]|nr:hypothetical protein [Phycisphaerales bacterium]